MNRSEHGYRFCTVQESPKRSPEHISVSFAAIQNINKSAVVKHLDTLAFIAFVKGVYFSIRIFPEEYHKALTVQPHLSQDIHTSSLSECAGTGICMFVTYSPFSSVYGS